MVTAAGFQKKSNSLSNKQTNKQYKERKIPPCRRRRRHKQKRKSRNNIIQANKQTPSWVPNVPV
jgi:hypothetical protein